MQQNIILRESDGCPVVMDFGVMKIADHKITDTGQFLGTKLYAPPEYLAGESIVDWPAVDIYCLGGIAYYLLFARAPWEMRSESLSDLLAEKQQPISVGSPGIARDYTRLIEQMLASVPSSRPAMETVLNGLESVSATGRPKDSS